MEPSRGLCLYRSDELTVRPACEPRSICSLPHGDTECGETRDCHCSEPSGNAGTVSCEPMGE
jgi:hypothetical protein